jgi:superfamily I DNA/RNA helicase
MKMALQEADNKNKRVLFLCASQTLRNAIEKELLKHREVGSRIKVYSVDQLLEKLTPNFEDFSAPLYEGIEDSIFVDEKYDAIFVDEAQDFTEEWARITKRLLVSPVQSRFGVFYDDVQVLRTDSFRDGFGIESKPYLLHENIRNTANIYYWTSEKTNLGTDVIANPVEGPTPVTEEVRDQSQLIHRLESLFKQFLIDEHLTNDSLVLITENSDALIDEFPEGIAKWKFTKMDPVSENEIKVASVEEYKGLEANMVIYIHSDHVSNNMNYIAYTRAKYYLIELIRR